MLLRNTFTTIINLTGSIMCRDDCAEKVYGICRISLKVRTFVLLNSCVKVVMKCYSFYMSKIKSAVLNTKGLFFSISVTVSGSSVTVIVTSQPFVPVPLHS